MARSCLLTSCVLAVTITIAACLSCDGGVCVNFTMTDYTVDEGDNVNVPIEISGDFTGTITVNIVAEADTAAEDEFTVTPETVIFTPTDVATLSVTVSAVGDMMIENTETFTLQLSAVGMGVDVTVGEPATVTITDTTAMVVELDQPEYSLTEGVSGMMATVSLIAGLSLERDVELTVETTEGTATDGDDYMSLPGTITLVTGTTSVQLGLVALPDSIVESVEMFSFTVGSTATATVSIMDSTMVTVMLNSDQYSLTEGGSEMMAIVSLTAGLSLERDVELTVETADVTATDGDDYMSLPDTITLATGTTSLQLGLMALTDTIVENTETFSFTVGGAATATVSIVDDTMVTVVLDSNQYSLTEGGSGMMAIVSLTAGLSLEKDVELTVETTDGTATDGDDYMSLPGTITIAAGSTSQQLGLMALTDTIVESVEMFSFTVDGTATATVSIMDSTMVTAEFDLNQYEVTEGGPPVTATVSLMPVPPDSEVTLAREVVVNIESSVPLSPADVTIDPVQITFFSDLSQTVTITALLDVVADDTRDIVISLSDDDTAVQNEDTAILSVLDSTVLIEVSETSFIEGEPDDVFVLVDNPASKTFNVTVISEDGTAEGGLDFDVVMTELFITPEETTYSIPVDIRDDKFVEVDEKFSLSLTTEAQGVVIEPAVPEIIIIDATILVTVESEYTVGEGESVTATIMTTDSITDPFTVLLTVPASGAIIVEPATFNFTSSAKTHNFTITAMTDNVVEEEQSVALSVTTDAVNVAIQSNMPTVIIQDRTNRPDIIDSETVSSALLSLLVANLSWTAPNDNNDPITEYTVSISSVPDGLSTITPSPPTATYLLLQVDPEVEYNVTITATNVVDTSDPSDLVVITGAMRDDANTTLITVLTTNLHIVLEWSPPPLSEPLESDAPSNSDFSVDQYILFKDADELDRPNSNDTEYIYTVGGDDESPTHFRIRTIYSDDLINGLNPETKLVVDIPTEKDYLAELPLSAREPPEEPITVSNGFTITWNQPELLQNQDLLRRYEVFVEVSEDGRRRRQSLMPTATIDDTNMRSYTFTDGQPFTEYNVRVDGIVELNGEEARVVALTSTPVRTAEGVPSIPLSLQVGDIGITEVTVTWDEPAFTNGIIIHYQVDVVGTNIREIVPTPSTMVTVTGLIGNTDYTVSVRAMNGGEELGEVARMPFKTAPGVVPPTFEVNTNLDTERYSLTINPFNTLHGPLSHYVIYVVESDDPPDTSSITGTNQIALAFLASELPPQVIMGNGRRGTFSAPNGGGNIPYNNRELDAGTIYYFFIRLYSSVDVTVFNDSTPQRPSTIILCAISITCEPVLFQLRFVGVSDCFQWRETQPGEKKDAIIASVTRTVDEICQCGFSQESFQDIDATAGFQCFVESPTAVTFRAKIESSQLISYIEEWVATQPSIVVQSSRLSIDSNCAVEIDNFEAPECTGTTSSMTSTINDDNTNSITGSVIGGIVGGLFILLIAVVSLVLIVFLLQRKRQKKTAYKLNLDKKEYIDIYETIPELPSFPPETIHLTAAKNLTQEPITTEDNPSYATHSTERCNPVLTDKQMDIITEDKPSYTTHSTERSNPVLTDCPIPDVRDEKYQNVGDYEIPEIP